MNDVRHRKSNDIPPPKVEAEADEVSSRPFQMPTGLSDYYLGQVQLKAESAGERDAAPLPQSGGDALPAQLKRSMESSFGQDFSDVRVHQGTEASSMGALAATRGAHLHFAPGQYDPSSERGRSLIGHELTHVVQQRAGHAMTQGKGGVNADPALEAEADRMGAQAARGEQVAHAPTATSADGAQLVDFREKTVSSKTMQRLAIATQAIQRVNNEILIYGAGNQVEDVQKSRGVSKLRADQQSAKGQKALGASYDYKLTQEQKFAERNEAVSGGKESARRAVAAEYYHAGVCDDYSYVTFNVLREIAAGEKIHRVSSGGLHHAFCIIGDITPGNEQDNELVVADPWPTRPQSCTWADFFGHNTRAAINVKDTMTADGQRGTKLHAKEVEIHKKKTDADEQVLDDLKLQALIAGMTDRWNHSSATKTDNRGEEDEDARPIFYTQAEWDERKKALMKAQFEQDLEKNKHLGPKAMKQLGLDKDR
jgi:hypothetical protein